MKANALVVSAVLVAHAVLLLSAPRAADLPTGLHWDKDAGVVWRTPLGTVWLDRCERSRGPVVKFLPGGERPLIEATVGPASPSQLRLTYRINAPDGVALDIVREIQIRGTPPESAVVETFTMRPSRPLSVDVQIERPFSFQPTAAEAALETV